VKRQVHDSTHDNAYGQSQSRFLPAFSWDLPVSSGSLIDVDFMHVPIFWYMFGLRGGLVCHA